MPFLIAGLIIGLAAQATSMVMQYQAQKDASSQARRMARYQKQVAENQAKQVEMNRARAEANERDAKRRRLATMESGYAASGVLLEGSPTDFILEQAEVEEYNIAQATQDAQQRAREIRQQGAVASWEKRQEAHAHDRAARMTLIGGSMSLIGSGFSAGGQISYNQSVLSELKGNKLTQ